MGGWAGLGSKKAAGGSRPYAFLELPPLGGAAPPFLSPLVPFPRVSASSNPPSSPMELPGLSFAPGLRFEDELRSTHGLPISSSLDDAFLLVAAFGRYKFILTPLSVDRILQASIGGNASCFKVSALSDRVFCFSVACKASGLLIRKLLCFECDLYKVFFFLWGGGGPNWRLEFRKFQAEEEQKWKKVPSYRVDHRSFAEVARRHGRPAARAPLLGLIGSLLALRLLAGYLFLIVFLKMLKGSLFSIAFLKMLKGCPSSVGFTLLWFLRRPLSLGLFFLVSGGGPLPQSRPPFAPDAFYLGILGVLAVGLSGALHVGSRAM